MKKKTVVRTNWIWKMSVKEWNMILKMSAWLAVIMMQLSEIKKKKIARNILYQILCPDWKVKVEISGEPQDIDTPSIHFIFNVLILHSIRCL